MLRHKRKGISVPKSSIILHLKPIFALRNILHPNAFLLQNGFNTGSAQKILKGKAVQINFRQLTTLCLTLNCTPNDLFALRDLTPPTGHQLEKLPKTTDEIINPLDQFKNLGLEDLTTFKKLFNLNNPNSSI